MTFPNFFVRVTETPLGRGVIATRSIIPGQVVGEVTGRILSFDSPDLDEEYCMDLDGTNALEPGPPFRFLNHSCEPNCEVFGYDTDVAAQSLWVEAIRSMDPGDELTIDYGWPAQGAIPCHCQSPQCRGWIVAESELRQLECDVGNRLI